jgi:hypothetical protein
MILSQDAYDSILEQVSHEGDPLLILPPQDQLPARADIPASWARILSKPDAHKLVLAELWEPVKTLLPGTLDGLKKKLSGVALLLTASRPPSLLYLFGLDSNFYAHRGFAPVSRLPELGVRLSADLQPLYGLHDGWVDFFSGDFGPVPSGQWRHIGAEEDGTGGFLGIFSNGSAALGFDLEDGTGDAYALWPDDDEVEEVPDFYAALDQWLAGQLKDIRTGDGD